MKPIRRQGWFRFWLSGGDPAETARAWGGHEPTIEHVARVLDGAREFARITRRGWYLLHLPSVGQVEWKSGYDFRTACPYLLVRVNGHMRICAWPKPGTRIDWFSRTPLAEVLAGEQVS